MPTMTFLGPRDVNDYTIGIVLERDANGNVVRSVGVGQTAEFTDEQVAALSGRYNLVGATDTTDQQQVQAQGAPAPAPAPAPTPAPAPAPDEESA